MNEKELDLNNYDIDYDMNNETQTAQANGEADTNKDNTQTDKIYVDIRGAVNNPYVYELNSGMRMYEAIEKAGGLRQDADTSNLNLAKILYDQDKITVLTKEEIIQGIANNTNIDEKKLSLTEPNGGYANTVQGQGVNLININTATEQELQTLNGIGPSTAGKIISYRDQHGNFQRIEELMNIKGIGEQTFKKYKDKITI